jgi:hypothetical protein
MQHVAIRKIRISLSKDLISELQGAILNERTLSEKWINFRGWKACHLDDANLVRFVASALVRCCRSPGIEYLYAADTVDLFRSVGGQIDLRLVPLTLDGISQACFGLPQAFRGGHDDFDWFREKAYGVSVFFAMAEPLRVLIMRDASTCTTIAGTDNFLKCMVKHSKRTWYEGVPRDGLSVNAERVIWT